jgi:Flp pilus assembly protein TadD
MSNITQLASTAASLAFICFLFLTPAFTQTKISEPVVVPINDRTTTIGGTRSPRISEYEKMLADDPSDLIAANNLGVLYFETGRYVDARDLIGRAAEGHTDSWNIQINASVVMAQSGSVDRALKYAQAAFNIAPKEVEVRQQLCNMYLAAGDATAALACFAALTKDDGCDPHDLLGYAETLMISGDPVTAETVIRDVVRSSPRIAGAYNSLGVAQFRQKHYPAAVESFRQAVSLTPDEAQFRYNLAVTQMATRNRDGALSQYNLIKTLDPKLAGQLYKMMFADKVVVVGH